MQLDEVHVWYVLSDRLTDPALLARHATLLTPEEAARGQRFMLAKDRHQHRIARALVRTTLSRYADVRPEAWSFTTNRYGRPEIAAPNVLSFQEASACTAVPSKPPERAGTVPKWGLAPTNG